MYALSRLRRGCALSRPGETSGSRSASSSVRQRIVGNARRGTPMLASQALAQSLVSGPRDTWRKSRSAAPGKPRGARKSGICKRRVIRLRQGFGETSPKPVSHSSRATAGAARRDAPPGSYSANHAAGTLVRAQDFHRVEPQGAVRGHQAGHQRNKGQCCRDTGKGQRI
jgi:hypothetical protein